MIHLTDCFHYWIPKELELGFRSWIQDICGKYKGIVNIDGKEICGAKEAKKERKF